MEVTNWPERIALSLLFLVAFLAILWLMRRAWNAKMRTQSEIAQPLPVPADFVADVVVHGRYLASTAGGAWLTRIVAHQLGIPARAEVQIARQGVAIYRDGAEPFFIPRADLVDVRSDRAIAGRAFEKDGIAIVTWRLGDVFIDSGFRADTSDGHVEIVKIMMKQESGA